MAKDLIGSWELNVDQTMENVKNSIPNLSTETLQAIEIGLLNHKPTMEIRNDIIKISMANQTVDFYYTIAEQNSKCATLSINKDKLSRYCFLNKEKSLLKIESVIYISGKAPEVFTKIK
jgi:hypothetical protein